MNNVDEKLNWGIEKRLILVCRNTMVELNVKEVVSNRVFPLCDAVGDKCTYSIRIACIPNKQLQAAWKLL